MEKVVVDKLPIRSKADIKGIRDRVCAITCAKIPLDTSQAGMLKVLIGEAATNAVLGTVRGSEPVCKIIASDTVRVTISNPSKKNCYRKGCRRRSTKATHGRGRAIIREIAKDLRISGLIAKAGYRCYPVGVSESKTVFNFYLSQ